MSETMKQTDAYSNFKRAVELLGDDKVELIVEALRDVLDEDELEEVSEGLFTPGEGTVVGEAA